MRVRTHLRPDEPEQEPGHWARRTGNRGLKIALVLGFLVVLPLALLGVLYFQARPIGLDLVRRVTARKFPALAWIGPAQLAGWPADSSRGPPLMLDARTAPEYELSHLAGARRIDPIRPLLRHMEAFPRDTPIVVYCSVGYRSGRVADWLRRQGFTNVRNLEGSLFAWANDGRPMEADGRPVKEVHPYNASWGRLLEPEVRADAPPVTDPLSLP
ncbi:MAG: rhodanese-like domain-containing protein [Gemmatimonadales bacterium]